METKINSKQNIRLGTGDLCPICISELDIEESIFSLECGHLYCKACIEELLIYCERNNKKAKCPLCQRDIQYKITENEECPDDDSIFSIKGTSKTLTCVMLGILSVYITVFFVYKNEI